MCVKENDNKIKALRYYGTKTLRSRSVQFAPKKTVCWAYLPNKLTCVIASEEACLKAKQSTINVDCNDLDCHADKSARNDVLIESEVLL